MKLIYQAAFLTVALALGSCSKEAMFDDGTGSVGHITKPGVEVNNAETVYQGALTRASYDISNYLLDFYRDGESTPYMSKQYNELGSTIDLPSGDWTISVRSHNVEGAGWECPYFTGTSEKFSVVAEKITTVEPIECKFSSVKVTVSFGEKLLASMSDVTVTVKAGQDSQLSFSSTESRAAYFAAGGSTTMAVTFSGYVNGSKEEFSRPLADVADGQWRKIFFGIGDELPKPDDPSGTVVVGGGSDTNSGISISIDYTDMDIIDGTTDPGKEEVIDKGDVTPGTKPDIQDPENPTPGGDDPVDPTPAESNFTFGGTLQNGGTYTNTELSEYTVVVDAKEPITAFDVRIDSSSLTPEELDGVGLADQFSLAYPGNFADGLVGLDFPCGDGSLTREVEKEDGSKVEEPVPAVLNATHVEVSVTTFMPLLAILGPSTSTFYMTVTSGSETKTISFTIIVE